MARRRPKRGRLSLIFSIAGAVLAALAFAAFALDAVKQIAAGRGVDLYVTGSGAKTTYISALALFAIVPLILGVAWVWSRWSREG